MLRLSWLELREYMGDINKEPLDSHVNDDDNN